MKSSAGKECANGGFGLRRQASSRTGSCNITYKSLLLSRGKPPLSFVFEGRIPLESTGGRAAAGRKSFLIEGFDPGSERTLAAWIRHASRTRTVSSEA